MADFKVPELGENIVSGDVTRVLVKVGDTIARDQPVLELETDKATIEVPSSVAGKVTDIKVKAGDKIKVGAVVLSVEDDAAGAARAEPAPPEEQKVVPMSRAAARSPESQQPAAAPRPQQAEAPKAPPRSDREPAPAAPSVRRLAREVGIDVNDVHGSGPGGRISLDDVKEHARRILTSVGSPASLPSTSPGAGGAGVSRSSGGGTPLPDFEKWGEVERQPMSNIRRKTAEHLSHAWNEIPHVTQFDRADMTAMEELRKKYREQVEKAGGNLTVTAMLVKIIATAVRKFPQFNASLDPEAQQIVLKKYVNVGVAVDTDRGLLVPVIRNADEKNIQQIAVEVHQAAAKARDRKLTIDEMSGGGITISNLGGLGGTSFTPIVNWPEVAILGVSRGVVEPVWRPSTSSGQAPSTGSGEGSFEPRQLLPLSLSYDHRVVDGADAVRFLRWVVEAIEQPFLLSMLG